MVRQLIEFTYQRLRRQDQGLVHGDAQLRRHAHGDGPHRLGRPVAAQDERAGQERDVRCGRGESEYFLLSGGVGGLKGMTGQADYVWR